MLGEYCGREGRGQSGQGHTSPVTPDTVLAEAPALLGVLGWPQQLGTEFQHQGLVGVTGGQWAWPGQASCLLMLPTLGPSGHLLPKLKIHTQPASLMHPCAKEPAERAG